MKGGTCCDCGKDAGFDGNNAPAILCEKCCEAQFDDDEDED